MTTAEATAETTTEEPSTEVATVAENAVEVLPSVEEARALTDQIKANVDHLWQLLADAYMTRAWQALGHASWDDYCQFEFGDSRLQLPREKRKETVCSLRSSGLTVEAISSATGASTSQVSRDAVDVSPPGKPAEGKRGPGRPKGSKNKAKGEEAEELSLLTVQSLPKADAGEFTDTEAIVGAYGTPDLGAVASGGAVMTYHGGYETDTFTPVQARELAAALLQAADRTEHQ